MEYELCGRDGRFWLLGERDYHARTECGARPSVWDDQCDESDAEQSKEFWDSRAGFPEIVHVGSCAF